MQCLDTHHGQSWAEQQRSVSTDMWTLVLTYRGQQLSVLAKPSDLVVVPVRFAAEAFNVDADFVKAVHKGKKLEILSSLDAQGVFDRSKLMLIASSAVEVEAVRAARSDPTIRGFEDEKRLQRGRERLKDPSLASVWHAEQDKEFCFGKLEVRLRTEAIEQ
jgi:hypothetical protein